MLINQEFDQVSGQYKASTNWMTPEWNCVTTVGVSENNFAEATGNMISQMSAAVGSPVYITFTGHNGQLILQPKM